MPDSTAVWIMAFGILILFVALVGPQMITAEDNTEIYTDEWNDSENKLIGESLSVSASNIDASSVDVVVISQRTGENATITVAVGDTGDVTIENRTVRVSVDDINSGNKAVMTIEHDVLIGWTDGAQTIAGRIGVISALLLFFVVVALVRSVIA